MIVPQGYPLFVARWEGLRHTDPTYWDYDERVQFADVDDTVVYRVIAWFVPEEADEAPVPIVSGLGRGKDLTGLEVYGESASAVLSNVRRHAERELNRRLRHGE